MSSARNHAKRSRRSEQNKKNYLGHVTRRRFSRGYHAPKYNFFDFLDIFRKFREHRKENRTSTIKAEQA